MGPTLSDPLSRVKRSALPRFTIAVVPRFVFQPSGPRGVEPIAGAEPLADTGLFVGDVQDPHALTEGSDAIAWAAPTTGDESFPTGEVTVRFAETPQPDGLDSFIEQHGLELRRRNEFTPEQIVVAPKAPAGAWLPDVVDRLNDDDAVAQAWPNTLSRYRRAD
jgi:hypothetical protein